MEPPDVFYARSGDVAIAYQVLGEGPVDLVFVRGFAGDVLSAWEQPRLVRFIRDLAQLGRVIMLDKRGTGLSDRVREVPTLETRMDDLRAVMDDAQSERAVMWTAQEGARLAALFAATYPERVAGLVLFDPTAKGRASADYPWAEGDEEWRARLAEIRSGWGRTDFLDRCLAEWAPGMRDDPDFRAWFHAHMRRGLSPGSALAFFRMMMDSDVSDVLMRAFADDDQALLGSDAAGEPAPDCDARADLALRGAACRAHDQCLAVFVEQEHGRVLDGQGRADA